MNRFSAQLVWKHNKRNFQPPANIGSPSYPASSFSLTNSLETATPTFSTPVLTPLSPHVSGSGKLCARVAKSGYILPKRFASSNISFIAFLAPAELELQKRSIDEFSGTQGSCGSYWENTVKRSQIWHLIFTYVWQLICVDCFTCFSTVGSLRVGRKRTFFVLPKFPSGRKSTLQLHLHRWIHFLLTAFDPVWPKPACTHRTSFVRVKPGNQGARKEISALELTANFYSIIQNFFFPSLSVSLVKVVCHLQTVKENPVEKGIGHCFSCRSGEKCTGATDHLSR